MVLLELQASWSSFVVTYATAWKELSFSYWLSSLKTELTWTFLIELQNFVKNTFPGQSMPKALEYCESHSLIQPQIIVTTAKVLTAQEICEAKAAAVAKQAQNQGSIPISQDDQVF